jgi:hypothetical protein
MKREREKESQQQQIQTANIHAALREFVDAFPYTARRGVKRMKRGKKARVFKNIPSARRPN